MAAEKPRPRPEAAGPAASAAGPERAPRDPPDKGICLGRILGAHGVRGIVRIASYTTEPAALASYGALHDSRARRFRLAVTGRAKGALLARIEGVADRDAAEALAGTALYVDRETLPPTGEEEYYHADLIGLRVETEDGAPCGRVSAVHDHGAGDIVEVERPSAPSVLLPFTREHVPTVDLAAGRMVVAARSLRAFGPPRGQDR